MAAMTERFEMRLDTETLDQVDAWRADQAGMPSRAEAIRRLIDLGLAGETGRPFSLDGGQKLIALMLCEVLEKLNVEDGLDAGFIRDAIQNRHEWAVGWRYGDLVGSGNSEELAQQVSKVLHMWLIIEFAFDKLSRKEKARVSEQTISHEDGRFPGFDWNHESEVASIATFMIDKMGLFARFKGRDLSCVMPRMGRYVRMLATFEPVLRKMKADRLSSAELIIILNAGRMLGAE
jgi:uncharacterized protein YfbU (UPF0304 family)